MTRIEILSVGLIIGVVGLASAFAVSTARERTRDVTRLAHVRELQIGLELYFNDHAAYPPSGETTIPLGRTTTACLSEDGFTAPCTEGDTQTAYVEFVPAPPEKGLKGDSSCGGLNDAYCYGSDLTSFAIQFELESGNNLLGLQKGANCVLPSGFKAGACPILTPVTE
jgi:hypothetical protein